MEDLFFWRRRIVDFLTISSFLLVAGIIYFLIRIAIPWILDQPVDGAPFVAAAFGVLSALAVAAGVIFISATIKKLELQLDKEEEEYHESVSADGKAQDPNPEGD